MESNGAEMTDFFTSYIDTSIIVLIFITVALIFFSIIRADRILKGVGENHFNKFKIVLVILVVLLFLKFTQLIVFNVPYLIARTPISYNQEMKKLDVYGESHKLGNFSNVRRIEGFSEKEVYVIVIGESTSRKHFDLQGGYYRETTPKLNTIKDELNVYNDVISPHAYTIGALSKALTLGNIENPKGKYDGSIIQLLNQAGFETYWISNQRPIGISDTHVTKIARGTDISIFLNLKHTSEQTSYDEILLKSLDEALLSKGDKKVIFLHMIGAHFYYEMRYPSNFNYFKDTPKTFFKKEKNYKVINEYDNVMRYTDSVLFEVIKSVKKQSGSSSVLYFSDHGQEVFDDIDFFGQTIDQMVTKNMYDIPMFLWANKRYHSNKSIPDNFNKRYMTDDMIHSIADLCGVKSNEIDSTRSLFNPSFKERQRIIKDTMNYDTHFKD
jgi:heptose-I-phosphate ethanolaminephosphotransferase